jgi:hypothetical protein
MKIYNLALSILGILLILLGFNSPMILIFPLWIFSYLFKNHLIFLFKKIPKNYGFIIAGIVYGLIIESFAIMDNLGKPKDEMVLLSSLPTLDLIYGFFYYFCVIIAWYIVLRKINFSKKEIFLFTGIYGVFVEQTGQVFIQIFTLPGLGLLYAILVIFVYGLFPMLAYSITENSFNQERKKTEYKHYLIIAFALFLQWAIYGNFILPILIRIFQ